MLESFLISFLKGLLLTHVLVELGREVFLLFVIL